MRAGLLTAITAAASAPAVTPLLTSLATAHILRLILKSFLSITVAHKLYSQHGAIVAPLAVIPYTQMLESPQPSATRVHALPGSVCHVLTPSTPISSSSAAGPRTSPIPAASRAPAARNRVLPFITLNTKRVMISSVKQSRRLSTRSTRPPKIRLTPTYISSGPYATSAGAS